MTNLDDSLQRVIDEKNRTPEFYGAFSPAQDSEVALPRGSNQCRKGLGVMWGSLQDPVSSQGERLGLPYP